MSDAMQCPDCDGLGEIPVGVHYISREMAIDAGYPEMEGGVAEVEADVCPRCQGSGLVGDSDE
jgi:DnaJ-class molecular chaperone